MSAKKIEIISLSVKNWEKYNGRTDVKIPTWYRQQNTIFDDPILGQLEPQQILLLIFILCKRSQSNSEWFFFDKKSACFKIQCDMSYLEETLVILERYCFITSRAESVQTRNKSVRNPDRSVRNSTATLQTDRQTDNTLSPLEGVVCENIGQDNLFFEIWNKNCGPLAKIKKWTKDRDRLGQKLLKENPNEEYWVEVIKKIADSPFCRGETGGTWAANIDFFLKFDTHVKVMEGKYDDKARNPSTPRVTTPVYQNLSKKKQELQS